MPRNAPRYLILVALLLGGVGASFLVQRPLASRRPDAAARPAARYVFYLDLAGWYEITADEKAVASPYDLRPTALPGALPLDLGGWHGTTLGPDPDIETLYRHPPFVMRREYVDAQGRFLWLTAISSRGPDSFSLFEHTPPICYKSARWSALADDIQRVELRDGTVAVRRGVFQQGDARRVVYYWYQWDTPERDAERGVTTWRVTADVPDDVASAEGRLQAFLRLLLDGVIPWHRF